jgi:transposase
MVRFCKKGIPAWMLRILEKYPTAQHLRKATPEALATIPFITKEKAEKLIAIAAEEIGSRCGEAIEQTMTLLIAQMRNVTDACAKLEKIMIASIGDDITVALINSIRGIGPVSAIGLAINMPDMSCLNDAGQLAAYWGLHPVFKHSGDGKSVARMSKAGRVQPRMILFMTAMSAIVHDAHIRTLYHRKLKAGMAKKAAIGYIMHKMARIVYGVVKSGKKYDASIDKANRTKTPKVSTAIANVRHQKDLRRIQEMDPKAPISRRESKRRAAMAETQDTISTKNEFISQIAA